MSKRIPSPTLVRFLLTKWALTPTTLGDVRSLLESFTVEDWADFEASVIKQDLDTAISKLGLGARVRDVAKPVVLCLFDDGQRGKTTLASLLRGHGIPIFPTDLFVASLREAWHCEQALRELARQTVPHNVCAFIERVETDESLGRSFVALFFDADKGFTLKAPVSVIEGYLHNNSVTAPKVRLDVAIAGRLREQGYLVWITRRSRCGP